MSNTDDFFYNCKRGNLCEVDEYINNAAFDINVVDKECGLTGLMYAAWSDKFNSVSSLLERPDIDINYQDPKYKYTALHMAAADNNSMSVMFLSMHPKCDVNLRNYEGQTAFMKAARCGMAKSVDILMSNKININDVDNNGCTALHLAVQKENKYYNQAYSWMIPKYNQTIDLLLSCNGIDLSITNKDGKTALDLAKEVGWQYAIDKLAPLTKIISTIPKRIPSTRAAAIKARDKIAAIYKRSS
jgi:ankyrin repeat protein